MLSTIILLNDPTEQRYARKQLLEEKVLEKIADDLSASGVDHVYAVFKEAKAEFSNVEVCPDLNAVLALLHDDDEVMLIDGLYPYLTRDTYAAIVKLPRVMLPERKLIKLQVKELAALPHLTFATYKVDEAELETFNDDLAVLKYSRRLNRANVLKQVKAGVEFIDYKRVYIGTEVQIEEGAIIYPDVVICGKSKIAAGAIITPGSFLQNAQIGANTRIFASYIINSTVGNDCTVGPFAHLRLNTEVADKARIGNFVEFKKTKFGFKSRAAHLIYLGDTEVGEDCNIGCGVVTVNYDGFHKYPTKIGNKAFIGSNANLIAPLTVGDYGLVAAGSTINHDVPAGEMGIARCRQENKKDFGYKYINKEKKQ